MNKVVPVFPFGHGLSYTTYSYDTITVRTRSSAVKCRSTCPVQVTVSVTNTGKVVGSEVMQLYLAFPSGAGEPIKQLKAFAKTKPLKPGEFDEHTFTLTERDWSVWDSNIHNWSPVSGLFEVLVGASSADIRITASFKI